MHNPVSISTTATHQVISTPTALHSTQAQLSWLARLHEPSRSLSSSSISSSQSTSSSTPQLTEAEHEAEILAEDEAIVDDKIRKYGADGIIKLSSLEVVDFNLLCYWQECSELWSVYPCHWKQAHRQNNTHTRCSTMLHLIFFWHRPLQFCVNMFFLWAKRLTAYAIPTSLIMEIPQILKLSSEKPQLHRGSCLNQRRAHSNQCQSEHHWEASVGGWSW